MGQMAIWQENFGSGCNTGQLATAYQGPNGTWTLGSTGSNGTHANQWYVSATEAGMGAGNCGDGCGNTPSLTNRSLHIGSVDMLGIVPADPGASYNAGGLSQIGVTCNSSRRIESPVISTLGYDNITVTFNYMENGDGALDNATFVVNDGSGWAMVNDMPKTLLTCVDQGLWTSHTVTLSNTTWNNANLRIGFEWVNNDDGAGTDPSVAIDDIEVNGTPISIGIAQPKTDLAHVLRNADGTITFQLYSINGEVRLALTDLSGRELFAQNMMCNDRLVRTIALPDAEGVYVATVTGRGLRYSTRIVK